MAKQAPKSPMVADQPPPAIPQVGAAEAPLFIDGEAARAAAMVFQPLPAVAPVAGRGPKVELDPFQPPPLARPFFQPVAEESPAPSTPPPPRLALPPIELPDREPEVAEMVLYWRANPGAVGGADVVPAVVHQVYWDGENLAVNLNVHELGFLQPALRVPYCKKARPGCWCFRGEAK